MNDIYFESEGYIIKGRKIKEIHSKLLWPLMIIAENESGEIFYLPPKDLRTKQEWKEKKGKRLNRGRRWATKSV